jgi:hypothetical protein
MQCAWFLMNLCVREAQFNREGLHEAVVRSLKEKLLEFQLQVQHYQPCWAKVLLCRRNAIHT